MGAVTSPGSVARRSFLKRVVAGSLFAFPAAKALVLGSEAPAAAEGICPFVCVHGVTCVGGGNCLEQEIGVYYLQASHCGYDPRYGWYYCADYILIPIGFCCYIDWTEE